MKGTTLPRKIETKRIKTEFLVQDPLSLNSKPVYDVCIGQHIIILNNNVEAENIALDEQNFRFPIPMINIDEPFDKTYKKRKVHPMVELGLDKLIEALYLSKDVKRIKAPSYSDAHIRASCFLAENRVGSIFINDISLVSSIDHYDFKRNIFSAPFLPKHVLMFVSDPEYMGVLTIGHDGMSFGAAVLVPQNAIIVECEKIDCDEKNEVEAA